MTLCPPIALTLWNGFLLIIPLLALRYGLPALVRRQALAELDYFPPVQNLERLALPVYFVTNTFLIFSPLLARIQVGTGVSLLGWAIHLVGVLLLATSLLHFSQQAGLKGRGVYRFSRNPICIGYLLIYLGIALLIGSWFHLALTVIYQVAAHGLILSEERWCLQNLGAEYAAYRAQVRRYL